jgi:hypothetical protein
MSFIQWLNNDHPLLLPFLLIGGAVLFSCLLQWGTRQFLGHERLKVNNEVAGFKFAVQGVCYAVLLAFVVVVVWDEYEVAEDNARAEAKASIDLFRLMNEYPDEGVKSIQGAILSYVQSIHNTEWKTMSNGFANDETSNFFHTTVNKIQGLNPTTFKQMALYQAALDLIRTVADTRRSRLESADGSIPTVMWIVLFAGGLITLAYPSFFSQSHFTPQLLMTTALALTISLILYVIVTLNFPFNGAMAIDPEFLSSVIEEMGSHLAKG